MSRWHWFNCNSGSSYLTDYSVFCYKIQINLIEVISFYLVPCHVSFDLKTVLKIDEVLVATKVPDCD